LTIYRLQIISVKSRQTNICTIHSKSAVYSLGSPARAIGVRGGIQPKENSNGKLGNSRITYINWLPSALNVVGIYDCKGSVIKYPLFRAEQSVVDTVECVMLNILEHKESE
jgi:hypothetical protein